MNKKIKTEAVDHLFDAILSLQNKEECYAFFEDLCTVNELLSLSQRFEVAAMLKEGKTYLDIAEKTGASTATISRVNRSLNYGNDGYELVFSRMAEASEPDSEEIIRIADCSCDVPRPDTGRWESAGAAILGKRCSVAWRVLDAQYWGVPQRRRRIFLVADFGGLTAPKILFEPESVPGDTGKGKSKGEEAPGAASLGAEETGGDRRMTGEENRKCAMNPRSYCITGNIIGRQLQNGGNGLGCLPDVSYSLTCMDRHAVFCEKETYQKTVGTLTYSDYKGAGNQYINGDKCVVENKEQVRRLTPLECERLQGFPDGWTDIPGASDNARYRALGNSVAIPCVDFVLRRIACFLQKNRELDENGDFEGV